MSIVPLLDQRAESRLAVRQPQRHQAVPTVHVQQMEHEIGKVGAAAPVPWDSASC